MDKAQSNAEIKSVSKRTYRLSKEYFVSSIKTTSTWILIIFDLFIMVEAIVEAIINDSESSYLPFFFLAQMCIYLLFFSILLFSLKQLKAKDKIYSGKGIKAGNAVLVLGVWILYGIAIGIIFYNILADNEILYLNLDFLIGIIILFLSLLLSFIANLSKERERLGNTEIVKVFFEPAGYLVPLFLCMVFAAIIGPFAILTKIFADIIINSPMNAESPFVFQLLGGDERLKKEGYYN